jgi:wobble nucleotide-excising tRNase
VTLNPEEYAEFEARAREGKRKVWQQIVAEAQAYAIGRELPSTDTETEIRHLRSELRRIGNNINQIARQMNRGRGLDADELRADFAELERIIMDYVEGSHRAAGSPPPDEEESG